MFDNEFINDMLFDLDLYGMEEEKYEIKNIVENAKLMA